MTTTTTLTFEPLTSSTGARVVDIDPREVCVDEVAIIREVLADVGVLVFHADGMTVEEQIEFTKHFGELRGHPVAEHLRGGPVDPVSVVENTGEKPSLDDQLFHTDYSFHTAIPDLAVLRPEEIPPRGGDTIWSNGRAAYEGLSETIRTFISALVGVHDAGDRFWFELERTMGADAAASARRAFPSARHPVVARHPVTEKPLLFVNPGYTVELEGLSPRESHAILELLFAQLNDPAFHYRHRWRPGDLVMWDEHTTVHMGPHDFFPAHRRLTRVTAGSRAPAPAGS